MTEVHFCNLCDQSVPQDQIDEGSAVRHGGRIVCATCRDVIAMSATGEKAKSARAGMLVPLFVGLVGWGATAFVWAELQDLHGDLLQQSSAQATVSAQALAHATDTLGKRLDGLDARAAAHDETLRLVREDAARQAEAVQGQMLALEKAADRIPDLADGLLRLDGAARESAAARTLQEQDMRDLRGALEAVRNSLTGVQEQVAQRGAAPAAAGFSRDLEELLAQLRDPDPLQRSIALEKLGRQNDPRLIPYVEPLLKDSYEMNRFYAASHLGAWKAETSLAALVEALQDEYSLVRKAANDALVAISGQDQNFDPKGNEAERRKGYERWKQWLGQRVKPAAGQAG